MLIIIIINDSDKKIKYIGQMISYEKDLNRGFAVSEWRNLYGDEPYIDSSGKMYIPRNSVKEDKAWIRAIFEILVMSTNRWIWK